MNENPTPMHLGPDGTLMPAPPLNTCQVCGEPLDSEDDSQEFCDYCNPDTPIQVMDDPNDGPIPADLLPQGTRIAAEWWRRRGATGLSADPDHPNPVRTACLRCRGSGKEADAPHLAGDGGDAPDMGDYAVLGAARRIFEGAAAERIGSGAMSPTTNWQRMAGQALAAARAFEEEVRRG